MSQTTAEREVEPNARYDAVFGTNYGLDDGEKYDEEHLERLKEETDRERAALDYAETEAVQYEDVYDEDDDPLLTWDHISVTEDPDLLADICSFFTGVHSGEDVAEIRRKLRTADVEWYANVFLVLTVDPGGEGEGSHV